MKNILKQVVVLTSVFGIVAVLGACSHHKSKTHDAEYQQTYQDADISHVSAKMYQRDISSGGEDGMGHIKFKETKNGLEMSMDMDDMRPGITYSFETFDRTGSKLGLELPRVTPDAHGKVKQTYMVHNLRAADVKNVNIHLIRDGKKVGWGTFK